jgi:hypothetical protein
LLLNFGNAKVMTDCGFHPCIRSVYITIKGFRADCQIQSLGTRSRALIHTARRQVPIT